MNNKALLSQIDHQCDTYCRDLNKGVTKLNRQQMSEAVLVIIEAIQSKRQIFAIGNGGSALTASHFATDWSKGIFESTGQRCGICSLSDNVGVISAIANDISYDQIFAEQLRSRMAVGDLLVAISGSGNSPNIVKAIEFANEFGGKTLGIVGFGGGKVAEIADHTFCTETFDMQISEDIHLMFCHIVFKACLELFKQEPAV